MKFISKQNTPYLDVHGTRKCSDGSMQLDADDVLAKALYTSACKGDSLSKSAGIYLGGKMEKNSNHIYATILSETQDRQLTNLILALRDAYLSKDLEKIRAINRKMGVENLCARYLKFLFSTNDEVLLSEEGDTIYHKWRLNGALSSDKYDDSFFIVETFLKTIHRTNYDNNHLDEMRIQKIDPLNLSDIFKYLCQKFYIGRKEQNKTIPDIKYLNEILQTIFRNLRNISRSEYFEILGNGYICSNYFNEQPDEESKELGKKIDKLVSDFSEGTGKFSDWALPTITIEEYAKFWREHEGLKELIIELSKPDPSIQNQSYETNTTYISQENKIPYAVFADKVMNTCSNLSPNGYSKQDYYNMGFSDENIDCWGLIQPGAPNPSAAGFVIADMLDGHLDGDINFPFT